MTHPNTAIATVWVAEPPPGPVTEWPIRWPQGWVWTAAITATVLAVAVLAVAVLAVAGEVCRRWWARRQLRTWHRGARMITIQPPPRVDPDGAVALWANLLGLLRPRWARLLHGQPHLGFDYLTSQHGIQIRIWVPGPIPPGLIEHAITAAWPGARTTTTPAPPPTRPTPTQPATTQPAPKPPRWFPTARRASAMRPGELVATGGELRLARGDALPIGHNQRGRDPIRALLAAPGPLGPGEYTSVQILARPLTSRHTTRTHRDGFGPVARLVRGLLAAAMLLLREILDIATPGPTLGATRHRASTAGPSAGSGEAVGPRERLVASAENRAAAGKTRGGAYATLIRYATTTPLPDHDGTPAGIETAHARAHKVVRGRAHAIASAFAGFSDHNHYRRHRLPHPLPAMRARRLDRGDRLSVAELAAIAHLPTDDHIPGLRRAGAAAIAPPPHIPHPGPGVKLLGDSDATPATAASPAGGVQSGRPGSPTAGTGGPRRGRPVGISVTDARHHLHVIGPTGSGKSSLLAQLVLADAHAGRGVLVIDPKGDLITDITAHLPGDAWRAGRVVLLDPDAHRPPPCLNPLAPHPTAEAALRTRWGGDPVVENIVSVFARLWAATWGPRTEDLLRVALLTLRAAPDTPTLAHIPALLTDPATRYRTTRHLHDPLLHGFWHTYNQLSDPARNTITAPLLNKLRAVLLRPFARHLLAGTPTPGPSGTTGDGAAGGIGGRSTVSLNHVLDRGGILLARLPKGRLGDDTTRLIGSLLLAQAWHATTARAHQPPPARRDATIVLDECQNFLHLPYTIEEMLAEARGFHVCITLANQHLAQLPRTLRDGIATNARNKIIFSVSPDDARDLARHTHPELGEHDLANLDGFHAAARLIVNGAATPAFTLTTRPLPHHRARHTPAA